MSNALNKEKTKSFGELKAEETIDSFCEKLNQSQFTNLSFYLNKNFYVDDEFMQPDIILYY